MVTAAEKKGTISAAESNVDRKNYGEHLEKEKKLVSQSDKENAQADLDQAKQQKADLLNKKTFTVSDNAKMQDLNKRIENDKNTTNNNEGMTLSQQMEKISQQKVDSQLGQALGIKKNIDAGVNYAENAMYGEESKQQSTMKKLEAQGGVDGAVKIDTTEASQKAAEQKGAVEKKQDEAEKLAGQIIGKTAADILEQTAGSLAAGKLASDHAATSTYDSVDQYAEAQAQKASSQATIDKTRLEKSEDQAVTQKKFDAMRQGAHDKELFDSQAIESGIATRGEDGKLVATTGSKFTDGLSALGAGDMATTSQLIIGGERLNVDTDLNGNAFVNRDSSENVKRGRDSKYGLTGYAEHAFGVAGEAAMFGLGGVGLAEGLARNAGMKNGIVKPIINSAAESMGFEKPFDSEPNKGSNINEGKTTDSPESKSKNSVHNDSFEGKKYNEGGGKTQAFKAYEESVAKNPQRGKFLKGLASKGWKGAATAAVLTAAYEGYDYLTDGGASEGVSNVVDFMTSSHGPKGGGGQTPGSSGYKSSGRSSNITGSDVLNTVSGLASFATPVASALFGSDLGSANFDSMATMKSMSRASVAPTHAQNAFNTPTGFNTMQAMGGTAPKTTYNDTTDIKNAGASIHKTDQSQATVDKLNDLNMGSDYQREAIEEQAEITQDFLDKLMKNNYNSNEGDL